MNKSQKIFKKRILKSLFNDENFLTFVTYSYIPLKVKNDLNKIVISKECNLTLIKNTLLQKTIKNTNYNKFSNILFCPTAIISSKQKNFYISDINNVILDKKYNLTILIVFLVKVPYYLSKMNIYLNIEKRYGITNFKTGVPFYLYSLLTTLAKNEKNRN